MVDDDSASNSLRQICFSRASFGADFRVHFHYDNVIKELVHAFSCVTSDYGAREVWRALTWRATVARGDNSMMDKIIINTWLAQPPAKTCSRIIYCHGNCHSFGKAWIRKFTAILRTAATNTKTPLKVSILPPNLFPNFSYISTPLPRIQSRGLIL